MHVLLIKGQGDIVVRFRAVCLMVLRQTVRIPMAESRKSFLYTYEQDRENQKDINRAQVAKLDDSHSKSSIEFTTENIESSHVKDSDFLCVSSSSSESTSASNFKHLKQAQVPKLDDSHVHSKNSIQLTTEDIERSHLKDSDFLGVSSSSSESYTASNFKHLNQAQVPKVGKPHNEGSEQLTTEDNEGSHGNSDTNHKNLLSVDSSSSEYTTASKSPNSQEKSFPIKYYRNVYCSIPKEDKYTCSIRCMTTLEDGELIVYDEGNFKIKAFDGSGYYIGSIENIYNVRDITAVDGKQFAITQEDKELLTIYLMHGIPKNPKGKQIPLPGKGYHCKYNRGLYAVICDISDDGSRSLIIMNAYERRLYKEIPNILVAQMEMNPRYDVLYVSDSRSKTVTCIDFKGNEVWVRYPDWAPCGLCIVGEEYLFVCSADTKKLFKLQLQGKHWEELTDLRCTRFHCYNAKKSIVYGTIQKDEQENVNKVHVFKVDDRKRK